MAARVLFRVLLAPWISGGHFFLAGFFRVSLHGLGERRTIRSKESSVQSKKFLQKTLLFPFLQVFRDSLWIRISDPRSLGSRWIGETDEFVTTVDSLVPSMHHDPSDLGPLNQITPKERTLWFVGHFDE